MSLLAKLTIASLTTITAGGGTALGIFSKSYTSSFDIKTTLKPEQSEPNLVLEDSGMQADDSSSDSFVGTSLQSDDAQSTLEVTEFPSFIPEKQPIIDQQQIESEKNLKGEGNCEVEDGKKTKVIDSLPEEKKYIAVFCKNSGDASSSLINWRGFLPEDLLKGGVEAFKEGDKFDIKVREEELQLETASEDLFGTPTNQAVFSSARFTIPSVTGQWGSEHVFYDDSEEPADVVSLIDVESVEKFYFQWL